MTKKLRALSTSDFHFEGLTKLFPHNHIQRQIQELTKIYDYALDNGIKHIFIPGDISDKYSMTDETYIEIVIFFKKYDGLINSYYLMGNHDHKEGSKTSMDLMDLLCRKDFFKTLTIYKNTTQVKIDGVIVNFLPHLAKKSIKAKKPTLNFCHIAYDGAVGDNGRIMKVKNNMKFNKGDFTISGHIHKHQYLPAKRLLFNGNPFQK